MRVCGTRDTDIRDIRQDQGVRHHRVRSAVRVAAAAAHAADRAQGPATRGRVPTSARSVSVMSWWCSSCCPTSRRCVAAQETQIVAWLADMALTGTDGAAAEACHRAQTLIDPAHRPYRCVTPLGSAGTSCSGLCEKRNADRRGSSASCRAVDSYRSRCSRRTSTVAASREMRRIWWVLVSFSNPRLPVRTKLRRIVSFAVDRSMSDQRRASTSARRIPVTITSQTSVPHAEWSKGDIGEHTCGGHSTTTQPADSQSCGAFPGTTGPTLVPDLPALVRHRRPVVDRRLAVPPPAPAAAQLAERRPGADAALLVDLGDELPPDALGLAGIGSRVG